MASNRPSSLVILCAPAEDVTFRPNNSGLAMRAVDHIDDNSHVLENKNNHHSSTNGAICNEDKKERGDAQIMSLRPPSTSTATISDDAQSVTAVRDPIPKKLRMGKRRIDGCVQEDASNESDEADEKQPHAPLHQQETEHEQLAMEAALRFHHNRRVLLARLDESALRGRLCVVRTYNSLVHCLYTTR
jgi:hypothetical protein